jgi:lantibiotic biosynthesis protein
VLASRLLRAARQDWYEQGDCWERLAAHRGHSPELAPAELGWIGRAHQLVLPLALDAMPPRREATAARLVRRGMVAAGDGAVWPRGLNVLAFGHPDRFDEILADYLPGLVAAVGEHAAAWWFRRQAGTARRQASQADC